MNNSNTVSDSLHIIAKADLHHHLGGSLPVDWTWNEMRKLGVPFVGGFTELQKQLTLQDSEKGSLSAYLQKFEYPKWITQWHDTLQQAARVVAQQSWNSGVRMLEVRFCPQIHLYGGLSIFQVVDAVLEGLDQAICSNPGFRIGLILSALRNLGPPVSVELAHQAVTYVPKKQSKVRVVGFDLAGGELRHPPSLFQNAYAIASKGGLGLTAHVGEETGPETIWEAIDVLGVSRIGHGCSAIKDKELVRRLARDSILVECCITSNFQTGAVPEDTLHPIFTLLAAGVPVAICTDNTTVSRTNATQESAIVTSHLSLPEIVAIHQRAMDHSFIDKALYP